MWYSGIARCHQDDKEFFNEFTGMEIAEIRAYIKVNKAIIRQYKMIIKELNHILNTSKRQYIDKTRINIVKTINRYDESISYLKKEIDYLEDYLKMFITEKDNGYRTIEKIRQKGDKNNG